MKVLAISFGFPPMVAPRSIQVARLLPHLDADVALVCADDRTTTADHSIEPHAEQRVHLVRRVPYTRSLLRRRLDGAAHRLHLPFWNELPDAYRRWARPALRAAQSIVAGGFRPDVLVSFGNPMTDHLVGLALHRQHGWPWVAHFSDPWTRNPYHVLSRGAERWNARREAEVMRAADVLLFPSAECADYMTAPHGGAVAARAAAVPHAFGDALPAGSPPTEGPLVIRHVGSLYGARTGRPVIDAVAHLARHDPAALGDVRIEFIGSHAPHALAAEEAGLLPPGIISAAGRVPYDESRRRMAAADGLLLLDGDWQGPGIFFPAKLADYIGADRPILALAQAGAAARIVRELGGIVGLLHDTAESAAALGAFLRVLRARRAAPGAPWAVPEVRARYAAPAVARAFHVHLAGAGTRPRA